MMPRDLMLYLRRIAIKNNIRMHLIIEDEGPMFIAVSTKKMPIKRVEIDITFEELLSATDENDIVDSKIQKCIYDLNNWKVNK